MLITVKIHPNSKKLKFILKSGILHCYLTKPPAKGEANRQLIKELTKKYGSCKIIKGHKSRTKIIEIST